MFDMILERGHFTERDAAVLMEQVLRAVFYMHKNCVAHRDLKPENFLLQKKKCPLMENKVKVIDFGIAATFEKGPDGATGKKTLKTKAGTPYYIAPEILKVNASGSRYNEKCDVWSCGVILYILLSGTPPFSGESDAQILKSVAEKEISFPKADFSDKKVSNEAKEWIKACCTKDPDKRCSAEMALNNDWMKNTSYTGAGEALALDKLKAFSSVNRFKKAALNIIAHHVDDAMVNSLNQQFKAMDANGDGELTIEEMKNGCRAAGLKDIAQVEKLFNEIDVDGSGSIGYTEFVAAMLESKSSLKREQYWEAFRVFDVDGNGTITESEFVQIMANYDTGAVELSCDKNKAALQQLFKETDKDGDGNIDFEEFVAMMRK
jgi:calcium-dependent protein kinase